MRIINNQDFHIGHALSAETLKRHFVELLKLEQSSMNIHYAPAFNTNEMLDRSITVREVRTVLDITKPNKAPGEDRIPYEFFTNATDEFLLQLTNVYNKIYAEASIDEEFQKTVIFPIHKKGSLDDAANYRGISFMNCVAKIFMGILTERLGKWIEENNILVEHQAGFRKSYSTADNIYNLASIVHITLAEKKKVYAFFVDFRAAFDKISRHLLIFKLRQMGISFKFVNMVEAVYRNTKSAVWTGEELSDYFNTESGVKQGCLLSPLLFSLYINDLNDSLDGGLTIEGINIKVLLYADDIVLLADHPVKLQRMISKLENYCKSWNLVVNTSKSKIMVFRNGGRLSQRDRWVFQGEQIDVVSEYKYLGVVLTPQMKFTKHILTRNTQAKSAINMTWKNFLEKDSISLQNKWNLYKAVCRSVQSYAAQVWGFSNFEAVDQLQHFFLKLVLRLPESTPNYALHIETEIEESHIFTLHLHMSYIFRTLFQYKRERLPHKLTNILIRRKLFWAKHISELMIKMNMQPVTENITAVQWNNNINDLLNKLAQSNREESMQRALQSTCRFYKNLDLTKGKFYLYGEYNIREITWIFKARVDLILLNDNRRRMGMDDNDQCTLCNLGEPETIYHFIGNCPVLRSQRRQVFSKTSLTETEVTQILNGGEVTDWRNLIQYIKTALQYRNLIITEYA